MVDVVEMRNTRVLVGFFFKSFLFHYLIDF